MISYFCKFILWWTPTKTFEIWKLENNSSGINETWPRYSQPQHLSLTKNGGCQWFGRLGVHPKKPQKCSDIKKISTLTSRKNSLKNAMKLGIFFTVFQNHLTLVVMWRGERVVWRGTLMKIRAVLDLF